MQKKKAKGQKSRLCIPRDFTICISIAFREGKSTIDDSNKLHGLPALESFAKVQNITDAESRHFQDAGSKQL